MIRCRNSLLRNTLLFTEVIMGLERDIILNHCCLEFCQRYCITIISVKLLKDITNLLLKNIRVNCLHKLLKGRKFHLFGKIEPVFLD